MKIFDKLYDSYLQNQFKMQCKKKQVILDKESKVGRECVFEGNNYVGGELHYCQFGYGSYIHKNSTMSYVKVGRFCAIGENVNVRLFQHPLNMVSISPCFYRKNHKLQTFVEDNYFEDQQMLEKDISVIIGNDVWIGCGALIKGGISIGDGAVIGAGAVVTKNVEPYAIVGGVPAKLIRYRFSKEKIDRLLKIKWWDRSVDWLKKNGDYFTDIDKFIKTFEKE